jgi:hypothetical protein
MKIWLTVDYYFTCTYRFQRALELLGHEVDVFYGMDATVDQSVPECVNFSNHDIMIFETEPYDIAKLNRMNGVPYYIHVVDLASLRPDDETSKAQEEQIFSGAEGFILSSEGYRSHLEHYGKPMITLYPWIPAEIFPSKAKEPSGITWCYEGGLGVKSRNMNVFFDEIGETVECYTKRLPASEYASYKGYLGQQELLTELTQYEKGICGWTAANNFTDAVTQIKVFDYWAAGLEPVFFGYGATTKKFIDQTDMTDRFQARLSLNKLDDLCNFLERK